MGKVDYTVARNLTGLRVLVCGSRDWDDFLTVYNALIEIKATEVIHGAAKGADSLGGKAAEKLCVAVRAFPADWKRYGVAAGPIRNQQMLDEGKPELVLAFHENLAQSRGTTDMVSRAEIAKIPVRIISEAVVRKLAK